MGMLFDIVYFNCPKCGAIIEEQSRLGCCQLKEYQISVAPLGTLIGLLDREVVCPMCGVKMKIEVPLVPQVYINVQEEKPEDKEGNLWSNPLKFCTKEEIATIKKKVKEKNNE